MVLTSNQFVYNGHPSYLYGLRFMWLDNKPSDSMSADKKYTYFKNNATNTFTVINTEYKEPLSFKVDIIADRVLSEYEISKVYAEFFNLPYFREMRVIDDSGITKIFKCIMINPERYEYGMGDDAGLVGFKATLVLESPFISEGDKTVELPDENGWGIYNASDKHEYVYPDVTIELPDTTNATDDIIYTIQNTTDRIVTSGSGINNVNNRVVEITKPKANTAPETIEFKPKVGTINIAGATAIDRTNKKFFRLVPGYNTFVVSAAYKDGTETTDYPITSMTLKYREDKVIT